MVIYAILAAGSTFFEQQIAWDYLLDVLWKIVAVYSSAILKFVSE